MKRTVRVGMPQMALGYLSENWLLKELGDLHWDGLCNSLQRQSSDLVDSQGRRLYATFVRICIDLHGSLKDFPEGDEINFAIDMSRFGRSTVQSTISIEGRHSSGSATLLTTFSVRTSEGSNALMKSEPAGEYRDIESASDVSPFLTEYSTIRSEYGRRKGEQQPQPSDLYPINPYTDSNGANLLYFAAYQNISDCLTLRRYPEERDVFTKRRDIYYFRNSDLTDAIYLEPVSRTRSATGRVDGHNLLFSASDDSCLAYTTTIKEAG
jgi:probable biosynthetic protein (TIGR04098 family)